MKKLFSSIAALALIGVAAHTNAAVTVGVDPAAPWIGFMNVSDLPADGGGYQFGTGWGTADLDASFAGDTLTLGPNTSIAKDPNVLPTDPYWWKANGDGNKNMDASFYVENSTTLLGQDVTFTGEVLSNTLVTPYTSRAFIKDFVANYSSSTAIYAPMDAGVFSLTMGPAAPGHHLQYGFETVGPNAKPGTVAPLGSVQVTGLRAPTVPEPSTLAFMASGALGLFARRRKRSA